MCLIRFVINILQKRMPQLTPKSIETQFWATKTVRQRTPSRRARHRKAPTIETVRPTARHDQPPLSGKTQTPTASDLRGERTFVHQAQWSSYTETSIHEHCEPKSYSIGDIEPVEPTVHQPQQTTATPSSVSDDTGSRIYHSLQPVCHDPRRPRQHSTTVVDTRCHKCPHEGPSWPDIQRLADTTNPSKMKEAGSTDGQDMLSKT